MKTCLKHVPAIAGVWCPVLKSVTCGDTQMFRATHMDGQHKRDQFRSLTKVIFPPKGCVQIVDAKLCLCCRGYHIGLRPVVDGLLLA